MEKLLKQLSERINSEWKDYYNNLIVLSKEEIIEKSYEISHYGEVVDFLINLDLDEWYPFDEDFITLMLQHKGSIIKKIYDTWMDFCNPEKFNFFTPEGLSDIIWFTFHKNEGGF
jgi:hypothetical protein